MKIKRNYIWRKRGHVRRKEIHYILRNTHICKKGRICLEKNGIYYSEKKGKLHSNKKATILSLIKGTLYSEQRAYHIRKQGHFIFEGGGRILYSRKKEHFIGHIILGVWCVHTQRPPPDTPLFLLLPFLF